MRIKKSKFIHIYSDKILLTQLKTPKSFNEDNGVFSFDGAGVSYSAHAQRLGLGTSLPFDRHKKRRSIRILWV